MKVRNVPAGSLITLKWRPTQDESNINSTLSVSVAVRLHQCCAGTHANVTSAICASPHQSNSVTVLHPADCIQLLTPKGTNQCKSAPNLRDTITKVNGYDCVQEGTIHEKYMNTHGVKRQNEI